MAAPMTAHAEPLHGRYETLRPADMAAIIRQRPIAFVPSGTLEWHSHHLPLGLDGLVAEEVCLRAARQAGGVVVPTTYWAIGGVPYPFTVRVEPAVVEELFVGILTQLAQIGFRCVCVLAGHYGLDHYTALKRAAVRAMDRAGVTVCALPAYELVADRGFQGGDHAGAWETSLLWALRPDLVAMDRLPPEGALAGVLGEDPRLGSSPGRGDALVAVLAERIAELVTRLARDHSASTSRAHRDTLAAQVRILDHLRADPANAAPVLARPALREPYLRFLDHTWRGEYAAARQAAEDAWLALTRPGPSTE